MSSAFVRILHAASLQLDCQLRGVGDAPRDAVDLLSTATLIAWDRLVEAAITHGVDAVLLTGDSFDASTESLAADVALRQGSERLCEHEIPLFVVPGRMDPLTAWQQIPALPDNVTVFDSAWDSAVDLTDNGKLLARILPVSAMTDVSPPELHRLHASTKMARDVGALTIGLLWTGEDEMLAPEDDDAQLGRFASLDLLACPRDVEEECLPVTDGTVQRQAAPQGMGPEDVGPHGATLLQFDPQRQLTRRFVPLGPVRREQLQVHLDQARHRDELCEQMLAQLEELPALPGEQMRIIRWQFVGPAAARQKLGFDESTAADVLHTMNGLTDQPGGLRYAHQLVPLWQGQAVASELGELWRDYLEYFDGRPPLTADELRAFAAELRPQQTAVSGPWERGLAQLDPQVIMQRARRYARKWFAGAS